MSNDGLTENDRITFNQYQLRARATAIYPKIKIEQSDGSWSDAVGWVYPALGLADEAGECLGKIKKLIRDKRGLVGDLDRIAIKKEMGDVLWYLAQLATEFEEDLGSTAMDNLEKLGSRKERGVLGGSGDNR